MSHTGLLAKEWARRSNFYFRIWTDSVGAEKFLDPSEHIPEESYDFVRWAVTVDPMTDVWASIQEVRGCVPRHHTDWADV